MKLTSIIGAMAVIGLVGASGAAQLTAADRQEQKNVTVTGCAVKGSGDGDGFLLANSVEHTTRTTTTPTSTGSVSTTTSATSNGPARVLYWLDDDDDKVEKLMGQLVEVTGDIEGDIKRGEIKAEREKGMIELEINAAGRKAKVTLADVPSAIGTTDTVKDREVELPYVVRKLDVKSAKSVASTCK